MAIGDDAFQAAMLTLTAGVVLVRATRAYVRFRRVRRDAEALREPGPPHAPRNQRPVTTRHPVAQREASR